MRFRRLLALSAVVSLVALVPQTAFATGRNWTGGGSDDNWSTDANWNFGHPNDGWGIDFYDPNSVSNYDLVGNTMGFSFYFHDAGSSVSGDLPGHPGSNVFPVTSVTDDRSSGTTCSLFTAPVAAGTDTPGALNIMATTATARICFAAALDGAGFPLDVQGPGSVEFSAGEATLSTTTGLVIDGTSGGDLHVLSPTAFTGTTFPITVENGATLTFDSASNVVVPNAIDGAGAIDVVGGAVAFDGTNAFTGTTTVSGGSLEGTGSIGAVVLTGGTLLPGSGSGRLTVTSLALGSASSFAAHFAGASVGTQYDQVIATGAVTLNNPSLDISLLSNYIPETGTAFTLLANHSGSPISGTFTGLPEGAEFTQAGRTWSITYQGNNEDDIVLTALSSTAGAPVPDTGMGVSLMPAHVVVLLVGCGVLVTRRRRIRNTR